AAMDDARTAGNVFGHRPKPWRNLAKRDTPPELRGAEAPRNTRDPANSQQLARLAIAGDGRAFAELYDRHERRVYGFCMRMLVAPHDAADATQETFLRLLQRLPALEGRDLNFAAYLFTVARNACYDMIEGHRRVEPVGEHTEPRRPERGKLEDDPE